MFGYMNFRVLLHRVGEEVMGETVNRIPTCRLTVIRESESMCLFK